MVECIPATCGFEEVREQPWHNITLDEVQQSKDQMKFGSSYGVSRKVVNNKVCWAAKLPANQSKTGKSIKLGMFLTAEDASEAVQTALNNQPSSNMNIIQDKHIPQPTEICEPSFCEREVVINRSYRDKLARKTKALKKKENQRNKNCQASGESFITDIEETFEQLRHIKSTTAFKHSLDDVTSQILCKFQDSTVHRGVENFCRDSLTAMWQTEHDINSDNISQTEWPIHSVTEFLEVTYGDQNQYGSWIENNVYALL
jgi:hypothetical protein